jgi:hypothetical protein
VGLRAHPSAHPNLPRTAPPETRTADEMTCIGSARRGVAGELSGRFAFVLTGWGLGGPPQLRRTFGSVVLSGALDIDGHGA